MEISIKTPIEQLEKYDVNIVLLIGNLLINIAEWIIETAPHLGKDPVGNTGGCSGYEDNENYKELNVA